MDAYAPAPLEAAEGRGRDIAEIAEDESKHERHAGAHVAESDAAALQRAGDRNAIVAISQAERGVDAGQTLVEILRLGHLSRQGIGQRKNEAAADLIGWQDRGEARNTRGRDEADAAAEIGDAPGSADFLPPHRKILAVEARAVEGVETRAGRDCHAADNVRAAMVEAGADRKLIVSLQAIAFADQHLRAAGGRIEDAGMHAVIDALADVDSVVARKTVCDEKIGVVEFEALRVFVGDGRRVAAVRRREGGGDRLDDRAQRAASIDPWIMPVERRLREDAPFDPGGLGDRRSARVAGDTILRSELAVVAVAAQVRAQLIAIAQRASEGQTPAGGDG